MMVPLLVLMVDRPFTVGLIRTYKKHLLFMLIAFIMMGVNLMNITIMIWCRLWHIFGTPTVYVCCNENHISIFIK